MKGFLRPDDAVPWSCAALVALLGGLLSLRPESAGSEPGVWQVAPWVFGVLLFGLPHGACDHLVAARLFGGSPRWNPPLFILLYLLSAFAVVVLWMADPALALGAFLLLTAWHWGSADAMNDGDPEGLSRYLTASLARGLLVVSAPVVFHPQQSLTAFGWLLGVFDGTGSMLPPGSSLGILTGIFAISFTAEALIAFRTLPDINRAARRVAELSLLVGLFLLVPPVAAVGVYFVFWHAWRHVLRVGRMIAPGRKSASAPAELVATVVAYHRKSLPLTAASLVLVGLLGLIAGGSGPENLFGVYLISISALTLPHAALVALLDRRELLTRSSS